MKRKYVPDLRRQMAVCEANYLRLMKLLPDLDTQDSREFQIAWRGQQVQIRLEVDERFRYTTTILISQQIEPHSRWLESPQLAVRLYHDASMAEVISIKRRQQLAGRYNYPNPQMHQPDEKIQLNEYLAEWLSQCLERGRVAQTVYAG